MTVDVAGYRGRNGPPLLRPPAMRRRSVPLVPIRRLTTLAAWLGLAALVIYLSKDLLQEGGAQRATGLATLALVVITAFYAWQTLVMTEATKQAADAASTSAHAAVANLNVTFEIEPVRNERGLSVLITNTGPTLFAHGARLGLLVGDDDEFLNPNVELHAPVVPFHMHRGDGVMWDAPLGDPLPDEIRVMLVSIFYSLDGHDPTIMRDTLYRHDPDAASQQL